MCNAIGDDDDDVPVHVEDGEIRDRGEALNMDSINSIRLLMSDD